MDYEALVEQILKETEDLRVNLKGAPRNMSAAQRARKCSVRLSKIFPEFRKSSVVESKRLKLERSIDRDCALTGVGSIYVGKSGNPSSSDFKTLKGA